MNMIERYVERMMTESTPDKPLWNIERINAGKANGWNYIDGCMITALLALVARGIFCTSPKRSNADTSGSWGCAVSGSRRKMMRSSSPFASMAPIC